MIVSLVGDHKQYDEDADGTNVNTCSRSPNGQLLVTGDDNGYVKLYRYPVLEEGNQHYSFNHMSCVMNVKFLKDLIHDT